MRESMVPAPLVADCVEVHLARHAPSGLGLYLTLIALTIGGALATPMVQVPVTVQAQGVLRPVIERQEARSGDNGIVHALYVRDGDRVRAGDTLLVLDARIIDIRLAASEALATARARELADLTSLLGAADSLSWQTLETPSRRQQAREHATILAELRARAVAEGREADRLRALLLRGFAAPEQVERQEAAHRTAQAAVGEHVERMRSSWSDAHARVAEELRSLVTQHAELREAHTRRVVTAPVGGTVEMAASLSPGSMLQQGERVATISPNTELVGEVLLSARDIALVRRGTPARLVIDALNYREWGVVNATVIEVADDASLAAEQPVFRVRCQLARNYLRLRGGNRVTLGKGMTFRARFVIAERSLLQLLFDGADEWLNPARATQSISTTRP